MRRINLLAIFAVILIIAVTVGAVFWFIGYRNRNNDEAYSQDILDCKTMVEVEEYLKRNKIETYSIGNGYCSISNVSVFDTNASVEIEFEDDLITKLVAQIILFQCVTEDASADESATIDPMSYTFTVKDKKEIEEAFDDVKSGVEKKFITTLENYDLIPTRGGTRPEDAEEGFYQGLFIREYSVRDAYGTLWLLRVESAYGTAQSTLIKLIDESGYEGFLPGVDLTKMN